MTISWVIRPLLEEQEEAFKRGGEAARNEVMRNQRRVFGQAYWGMAKAAILSGGNPVAAVGGFFKSGMQEAVRQAKKAEPS